jgi:hypothetical protein
MVRQAGVPSWDTIWAEDGSRYLADALDGGGVRDMLVIYSGYLQPVPRVVAGFTALLPISCAARVLAAVPAVIVSGLSLYVLLASGDLIRSPVLRGALAALVALAPASGHDATANVVNLQWHFLLPTLVALVRPSRRGVWFAVDVVVVVAGALSGPLALLFLPVAVGCGWRNPEQRPIAVAFGAALIPQAIAVGVSGNPLRSPTQVALLPGLYLVRVVGSLLAGDAWLEPLWRVLGWWLVLPGGIVLAALGVWAVRDRANPRGRVVVLATAMSVVVFAIPVGIRGTSLVRPYGEEVNLLGARWMIAPIALLALAVLLAVERLTDVRPRIGRIIAAAVVILIGASIASSFRVVNARSPGPSWVRSVAHAEGACADLGPGGVVRIPIPPIPPEVPEEFFVRVPCDRLGPAPG